MRTLLALGRHRRVTVIVVRCVARCIPPYAGDSRVVEDHSPSTTRFYNLGESLRSPLRIPWIVKGCTSYLRAVRSDGTKVEPGSVHVVARGTVRLKA